MNPRFLAFSVVSLLLVFGVVASFPNIKSAYAVDDLWYPGEGVKQDMYVKYRIQELDANDGQPYEMTIYFEEMVDGDWMTPTFIVDQNSRVYEATLKFSDNMAPLFGGITIPQGMNTFISGYSGSLHWLDAFTTKSSPLSLTQQSWGKIAAIGGEEIRPRGTEKVSFAGAQDLCQADSCNTTLVSWHKGVDSKIWVANEFPFPVKAETYVVVTSGQPPIQFAFELLETGMGKPTPPTSEELAPKPPLVRATPRGTFEVELNWEPTTIEPGKEVTFDVFLTDNDGFPLERVNYSFIVEDETGQQVVELMNQNAEFGVGAHQMSFENGGRKTITVTINTVDGQDVGGTGGTFTESAEFNIVVVPEFPISAAIVAGAVIGMVVLMTRARGTVLGSIFGNKPGSI